MAKVAPQAQKYLQRWPARNLGCATMFAADFYLDFWGKRGRLDSSSLGEDQAAAGNYVGAPTGCQQGSGGVVEPPV
jgi:hypothetical protein